MEQKAITMIPTLCIYVCKLSYLLRYLSYWYPGSKRPSTLFTVGTLCWVISRRSSHIDSILQLWAFKADQSIWKNCDSGLYPRDGTLPEIREPSNAHQHVSVMLTANITVAGCGWFTVFDWLQSEHVIERLKTCRASEQHTICESNYYKNSQQNWKTQYKPGIDK